MSGNGNGHNGRYTCQQFIDAIPGTGGIVSELAARVGCTWHTAKRYITEYVTVEEAWEAERNRIGDIAKSNIIEAIKAGDLATSKWYVQLTDAEFMPTQRQEITGSEGGPLNITLRPVTVDNDAGDD